VSCGTLSRVARAAAAARSAGYDVTLIGAEPSTAAQQEADTRQVTVGTAIGAYREHRPRPGVRRPLAYRSAESYRRRSPAPATR
jgi:hypothetical protein